MPEAPEALDRVLELARKLTPLDKLRLIERLAPELEAPLRAAAPREPRRSLEGFLKGCEISEKEIQEARREMWGNFPRGEI